MKKITATNMIKRVIGIFLIAICSIAFMPAYSEDIVQNGFTAYAATIPTIECGKTYTITMDYDTQYNNNYVIKGLNDYDLPKNTYRFYPKQDASYNDFEYKITAKYVSGSGVCSVEMWTNSYPTPDSLLYTHICKEQPSDSKKGKFIYDGYDYPDPYDYYFLFYMGHHWPMDEGYVEGRDAEYIYSDPELGDDYLKGKKLTIQFRIDPVKEANPIMINGKTVTLKRAKLKQKSQTVSLKKAFDIGFKQSKVSFKKVSGNKKITVSSKGKITVKKGLKKGTYKVKVKCTAAANTYYKKKVKTTTVTIKVK